MNDVSSQRRVHLLAPAASKTAPLDKIERLSAENAVVVFSTSGCCMSHVVKSLFCGLGVNPLVYELDQEKDGQEIEAALGRFTSSGGSGVSPTVFVGGKLVGGLDQVMAAHINGTLVPRLKEAGALWL